MQKRILILPLMKRRFFIVLVSIAFASSMHSQNELLKYMQNIHTFNRLYPQEKVWLHCDNTAYFQSDTIWFAAYVTSAETLQSAYDLSKVLYVELLNETGEVVSTQRLPIEDGHCHGQIPLNTELEKWFLDDREQNFSYPTNPRNGNLCLPLPSGFYEVRAYTRAMLNWGSDVCFSRVFPVFDTPEREGDYSLLTMENNDKRIIDRIRPKTKKDDHLNVDFYPEGGNIVCGLPCRVAYKVTDKEGRNLHARCQLLADGEPVTSSETVHDGMGSFSLLPQDGIKYKLRVETDKHSRTFNLPDTRSQGAMLAVDALGKDSVRMAVAATDSLLYKAIGMSITCRGKLLQFNAYSLSNRPTRLPAIAKNALLPGVNQVTLFDANGQVYAERLFFVHDTTVVGKEIIEYQLDKEEYKPFEKISLTLQARRGGPVCPPEKENAADSGRHIDLPLQYASISVRDSGTEIGTNYTDNLQTYLLLTSDLKGYIHRPDYYFEADDSVHRTALDLLMMTQGWRRYAWKQLTGVEKFETPYVIEEGLILQGQIKSPGKRGKPLNDIQVGAVITHNKKVEQSGFTITDEGGDFSFKMEPFIGRRELSMNITDRQGVLMDSKILLHRHFSPQPKEYQFQEKEILSTPQPPQVVTDTFSFTGANLLGDVQINKSRRQFEPFILHNIKEEREKALDTDDRYFMSYRVESYVYDRYAVTEKPLWSYRTWSAKQFEYQDYASEKDFGSLPDMKAIHHTSIDYVDYIQVYTNNMSHRRTSWIGDGNIRMAKEGPRMHISSWIFRKPKPVKGLRNTHIDGYSEVIDYYHPQYNREIIPGEVDYRRTLYWNPRVELDEEGKADVTFYNNGNTNKVTVNINTLN